VKPSEGILVFGAVIFDLGDTLVKVPWDVRHLEKHPGTEISKFESILRVAYDSIVENGVKVNWKSFYDKYMTVRAEQLKWQKQTLREYDMSERLSRTLHALGFKVSPDSALVKRALKDQYAKYINQVELEEGVHNVLRDLRLTYKLGLITNFAYTLSIYQILDKFDIRQFFDVVVVSREVGWIKPSPRIFEVALSALKLRSNQCVFVGDDVEADIKGAKGVGMKAILLSRKGGSCKDADAIIGRISELPSALNRLENFTD
jgi:putative hydrolase of the HAD superfamily